MAQPMEFDVVVVGAGLFGSAAAKYITSLAPHMRVCLIGPSEPKNKTDATIHAAHHDETRCIRSVLGYHDAIWGQMTGSSVMRYRDIEQQSGLSFYNECGSMTTGESDFIERLKTKSNTTHVEHTVFETTEMIKAQFPFLNFDSGTHALFTPKDSGYLNPRRLLEAQKTIAQRQGCDVIDDVVHSVRPTSSSSLDYVICTESGREMRAKKVLLCTGGFTHFRELLPAGVVPRLEHHPNTFILVEVSESERRNLEAMPCMIYKGGRWDRPDLNYVAYIAPPARYPDGKYYLKLGHGCLEPALLSTPHDITEWYKRGRQPEVEDLLYDVTRTLFPDLKMASYKFDYCVTTNTPQGYPYIDMIRPSLGVAIAGCGQAAKCADEIGMMAARMIVKGHWDHDLPEKLFKFESQES